MKVHLAALGLLAAACYTHAGIVVGAQGAQFDDTYTIVFDAGGVAVAGQLAAPGTFSYGSSSGVPLKSGTYAAFRRLPLSGVLFQHSLAEGTLADVTAAGTPPNIGVNYGNAPWVYLKPGTLATFQQYRLPDGVSWTGFATGGTLQGDQTVAYGGSATVSLAGDTNVQFRQYPLTCPTSQPIALAPRKGTGTITITGSTAPITGTSTETATTPITGTWTETATTPTPEVTSPPVATSPPVNQPAVWIGYVVEGTLTSGVVSQTIGYQAGQSVGLLPGTHATFTQFALLAGTDCCIAGYAGYLRSGTLNSSATLPVIGGGTAGFRAGSFVILQHSLIPPALGCNPVVVAAVIHGTPL